MIDLYFTLYRQYSSHVTAAVIKWVFYTTSFLWAIWCGVFSLFCIALNTTMLSLCNFHNSIITCTFHINYLHEWIQWGPWHFCTSIGICIDYSNLLWLVTRFGFFFQVMWMLCLKIRISWGTLFKKPRDIMHKLSTRGHRETWLNV